MPRAVLVENVPGMTQGDDIFIVGEMIEHLEELGFDIHTRRLPARRGVLRLAGAEMNPYLDLVAVSRRTPRGVICLNSALSFWDLTDEVPTEVHLAVPRGTHRPVIDYPPVRVHVFAASTFDLGHERIHLDSGEEIFIYSAERSVIDAVRLRGQVGADVAYEALRRYLRRPGTSTGNLLSLARRLRVGGPVSEALIVLMG